MNAILKIHEKSPFAPLNGKTFEVRSMQIKNKDEATIGVYIPAKQVPKEVRGANRGVFYFRIQYVDVIAVEREMAILSVTNKEYHAQLVKYCELKNIHI